MLINKKGAVNVGVGILIILGLTFIWMVRPETFAGIAGIEAPETTADLISETCADPSNTVTWGDVSKEWAPSTTIAASAGTSIRYYLNGGTGTSTTSGSTKTLAWKDTVSGLYSYGSSADTTYYTQKFDFEMPCKPIFTKDYSDATLLAVGTVTWDNFNVDTGNKNDGTAATDNETIGEAETGEFDLAITTGDKTGISTPGGKFMLIAEFNKSMYDESLITLDGKSGIQVPQSYTIAAVDNYAVGWEFDSCPVGDSRRCDVDLGRLLVQADVGENPGTGAAGGENAAAVSGGAIKLTIRDQAYGINTLTDAIIGPAYDNNEGTSMALLASTVEYLAVG